MDLDQSVLMKDDDFETLKKGGTLMHIYIQKQNHNNAAKRQHNILKYRNAVEILLSPPRSKGYGPAAMHSSRELIHRDRQFMTSKKS